MPDIHATQRMILHILEKEMPFLRAKYGVQKIALFGSFAHSEVTQGSDVDLLVEFSRPLGFEFMQLADYLESKLGRKVDLITFDSLRYGSANPRRAHIAASIMESLIYVAPPA